MSVIFDLDMTLVDSSAAESYRAARNWTRVYGEISAFPIYDGIKDMIAGLERAGVEYGIVTSSPYTYCYKVLKHLGIEIERSRIVAYHDTERRKPHPDPFSKLIQRLRVPASDVIAIGDHPNDIIGARTAGAIDVAALWGCGDLAGMKQLRPTHSFASVAELHSYLQERYK